MTVGRAVYLTFLLSNLFQVHAESRSEAARLGLLLTVCGRALPPSAVSAGCSSPVRPGPGIADLYANINAKINRCGEGAGPRCLE